MSEIESSKLASTSFLISVLSSSSNGVESSSSNCRSISSRAAVDSILLPSLMSVGALSTLNGTKENIKKIRS